MVKNLNVLLAGVVMLGLAACVAPPPQRTVVREQPVQPTQLYIYPGRGQSPEQTERDRYECHNWAVQQAGFDPSQAGLPANERVLVTPANPPGAATAFGAVAGAILGAVVAGPRNAGGGAIVGAIAGGAVGASSDVNAQAAAAQEQAHYDRQAANRQMAAANYRRAMTACLDGRGYTVR